MIPLHNSSRSPTPSRRRRGDEQPQLEPLLAGEPEDVQAEILRINKEARDRSLQVALLVPVIASLLGLLNGFRMRGLPDPTPASTDGVIG